MKSVKNVSPETYETIRLTRMVAISELKHKFKKILIGKGKKILRIYK